MSTVKIVLLESRCTNEIQILFFFPETMEIHGDNSPPRQLLLAPFCVIYTSIKFLLFKFPAKLGIQVPCQIRQAAKLSIDEAILSNVVSIHTPAWSLGINSVKEKCIFIFMMGSPSNLPANYNRKNL